FGRPGRFRASQLAVTVCSPPPDARKDVQNVLVAGAIAQWRAQVGAPAGKQARVQSAICRQPCTTAGSTERCRYRRDEADLSRAILVGIAAGDFTRIAATQGTQRPARVNALEQLTRGHDLLHAPAVAVAYIHVLDQANDVAGTAEMREEIEYRMVVHATLHHRIDLHGRETGTLGCFDALQNPGKVTAIATHAPEHDLVQAVEADRNAVEAGL